MSKLKIGDKVQMNKKYYVSEKNRGKIFTVISEPQEVCGTLSVWLEGYRGCYAVDGLRKLIFRKERQEMSRVLPILFNTDMVRAILREKSPKTVTRRCIKGYIPKDAVWGYTAFTPKGYISCKGTFPDGYGEKFFKLPCQPGDILYVRETFQKFPCYRIGEYPTQGNSDRKPDSWDYVYKADNWYPDEKWIPSIHMPKEGARIWLKVTDVRVERLQDMTLDDFLSEGVVIRPEAFNDPENANMQARSEFVGIWNSTIRKSDNDFYGWDANPWTWIIEFERCEKPEEN